MSAMNTFGTAFHVKLQSKVKVLNKSIFTSTGIHLPNLTTAWIKGSSHCRV